MSGTAVMLGVTGLLVGAVFLTSIFLQTALGFSAVKTGVAFLPFALAITGGTVVARHLLGHLSPRVIAAAGLLIAVGASLALSTATAVHISRLTSFPGCALSGSESAWSSSRCR